VASLGAPIELAVWSALNGCPRICWATTRHPSTNVIIFPFILNFSTCIMKRLLFLLLFLTQFSAVACGQVNDDFSVELVPMVIEGVPGLQSYAFAQQNGRWLVFGGRTEGIHARQGHSSFPAANNNKTMYVIDIRTKSVWSATVDSLPETLREQLQSTNMQFYQDGNRLVVTGGYAMSATQNRHMTYPYITVIDLPGTIEAITGNLSVQQHITQIEDEAFALTGGQLGKLGDTFYLVGGHRFDGRYNPHGPEHGMGFRQEYSNEIRKFRLSGSGASLSVEHLGSIRDEDHLRRRDFNLLPQVFADGTEGLTISSGVFQKDADLPFLYPVEITTDGHKPILGFNQLLSNYHSAKVSLYSRSSNQMHHVFFGGISQHYLDGGTLVKDDQVPFVKTISRLTRDSSGNWEEVALPVEMPGYAGGGAEFIPNVELSTIGSRTIDLDQLSHDGTVLGYIYGGISSPMKHAFFNYETAKTSADATIYEVKLVTSSSSKNIKVDKASN